MILCNPKYDFEISFSENIVNCITIENQIVFADIIQTLIAQIESNADGFILSDADEILNISKNIIFVRDIFAVDCNDKKILNRIYKELEFNVQQQLMTEFSDINQQLVWFVDETMDTLPYNLTCNVELKINDLLKIYNVHIMSDGSYIEKLYDYLRIIKQVLNVSVVVFLNIKEYLTNEQLDYLYEFCGYEKIFLVLLEGRQSTVLKNEKHLVIDKDLCKIVF